MDNKDITQIIDPKTLAEFLRVSKSTVEGWRDEGLPYIKAGAKTFFYGPDVVDWMLSNRRVRARKSEQAGEAEETSTLDPL